MSTQEQRFGLASVLVGIGLAVVLAAGPTLGITLPRSAIVVAFALAALLAVTGVGLLLYPAWKWGRRWWAGRGEPRLDVEPTGGPRQDLRLFVIKRGPKTEFRARATVVASRNYPNQLRKGSYVLLWLGPGTAPSLSIPAKVTLSWWLALWSTTSATRGWGELRSSNATVRKKGCGTASAGCSGGATRYLNSTAM